MNLRLGAPLAALAALALLIVAAAPASAAGVGAACKVNPVTAACPAGQAYSGFIGFALNTTAGPVKFESSGGSTTCNLSNGYGAITTNRQTMGDNIHGYLYGLSFSQNGGRCPSIIGGVSGYWAAVTIVDTNGATRGAWGLGVNVNDAGTGGSLYFHSTTVRFTYYTAATGGSPVGVCDISTNWTGGAVTNSSRSLTYAPATVDIVTHSCPAPEPFYANITAKYTTFATSDGTKTGAHIPIYFKR